MIRNRRFRTATVAAVSACALVLSACGSGSSSNNSASESGEVGDPVAGGTARIIQSAEPRTLDPAGLSNNWAFQPVVGNALYGALLTNDVETLDVQPEMATEFTTTDGGSTFTLKLRPGIMFTDGTPLDAAAVKFNWDRLRDPAVGSNTTRLAVQVASTEVVDPATLRVTMASPNPTFANAIMGGAMNWIASPAALQQDAGAFDAAPVGAGPFTLSRWNRQDVMEFSRNPNYYDAPKPYLDGLSVRFVGDANQRLNTMTTGGAELASESSRSNLALAEDAGLQTQVVPSSGGQFIAFNFRRAPFDDERARRAITLALDTEALDTVVYNGEGIVPTTFFEEGSPFFTDEPLPTPDHEAAQQLFDELAAEGKPVKATYVSYATTESKVLAEAVQAQLSAYDNVEIDVQIMEFQQAAARAMSHDFDLIISSAIVQDPDLALWNAFYGESKGNFTGVDDPQLDAALAAGRVGATTEDRRAAYDEMQKRLIELSTGPLYTRATPSVIAATNLHGVHLYTLGSPMPEELWLSR